MRIEVIKTPAGMDRPCGQVKKLPLIKVIKKDIANNTKEKDQYAKDRERLKHDERGKRIQSRQN